MEVKQRESQIEDKVTPEEWLNWKAHPTTIKFFQYCNDFRIMIAEETAEQISHGNAVDPDIITTNALYCEVFLHIQNIETDDINNFYEIEKEDES